MFDTNNIWKVIKERRRFQDYVIVHELLHIEIPNHGKLFKSMMNAYIPDWKNIELLAENG